MMMRIRVMMMTMRMDGDGDDNYPRSILCITNATHLLHLKPDLAGNSKSVSTRDKDDDDNDDDDEHHDDNVSKDDDDDDDDDDDEQHELMITTHLDPTNLGQWLEGYAGRGWHLATHSISEVFLQLEIILDSRNTKL